MSAHPPVGHQGGAPGKILGLEGLLERRAAARAAGRRVAHCHGCFDIVHPGHIRHLRHARTHGDILLVSVTGDAEMRKGTGRPLIPEELRAENLAALDFVDWVFINERETAEGLLEAVRPDVYVKGREYELNDDPRFLAERRAVERHGGRVVFSSGDVVFSSTALVAALERAADPYHARLASLLGDARLEGGRLGGLVRRFRGQRALVVGEAILDTYVLCDRPEVAGESPVMTLRPLERRQYDGGAAVVARHLAAMGARPVLVTALPEGAEAEALTARLAVEGVEVRAVRAGRRVAEKQRFLVGAQKVMKLDLIEPLSLDAGAQDRLVGLAVDAAGGADGIEAAIIADFGLGLFSPRLMSRLCGGLRPRTGVMAGDVSGRRSHLRDLARMDLLCPSETELRDAYRSYDEGLPTAVWRMLSETRSRRAVVTMGAEGLVAFERREGAQGSADGAGMPSRVSGEHVPALCGHAVDPLGCGDALLAAATLALAAGGGLVEAAFLGAIAASAQAQRLGNTAIGATDLRQGIARVHAAHLAYQHPEAVSAASGRAVAALAG
ncbi:MAG TPA: PfkB family carbohydrate kinase [Phycisphaerales bacterium]|nr:PfkB family carbohydrate kinase [Phycisphaerales bacterium]